MLAILLPVVLMICSIAVDGLQAVVFKQKLQNAADATILAVVKKSAVNEHISVNELKKYGEEFLKSQFHGVYKIDSFIVNPGNSSARIELTGNVHGIFSSIFNVEILRYKVISAAEFDRMKLEVALVLDNSRSISDAELAGVKAAAKELVDSLMTVNGTGYSRQTLISIVPFAGTVRLPQSEMGEWWIDLYQGTAPNHRDHINRVSKSVRGGSPYNWNPTRGELFDQVSDQRWAGCVEHRQYPFDTRDFPALKWDPSTWFLPYFAFDIPDIVKGKPVDKADSANNNWLEDDGGVCSGGVPSDFMENVDNTCKYGVPGQPVTSNSTMADLKGDRIRRGPNFYCTMSPLLPLTSNRDEIFAALDAMVNDHINVTDLTIGLTWGWRALTPSPPLDQSTSENFDNDSHKILILMTDGANASPVAETRNYGAWGFPSDGRLDRSLTIDSKNEVVNAFMDRRTSETCSHAKYANIKVITVNFGTNDDGIELLRNCASSPADFYLAPDVKSLNDVFRSISQSIGTLRLTK